jgi:hypothetical protein
MAKTDFNLDLITQFPSSNKKVAIQVKPYNIVDTQEDTSNKVQTSFISPHGFEFQAPAEYGEGMLLKIEVKLPNYWTRKQQFVDYTRIDAPDTFKVLARVVKTEDLGKRGRKKIVTVQTVNIDEIDEKVLRDFLSEGK